MDFSAIIARLEDEPVLVTTFVGAILTLGIAFGLPVTDDQKVAIIAAVTALLAIFARSKVTPV